MTQITSYTDLIVWQKSMRLVVEVYKVTAKYPKTEIYNLVSQMRRCCVSIPSNIAEGCKWCSRKDFRKFLIIAYGSAIELETQIEISRRLLFVSNKELDDLNDLLIEILKMLNKMIYTLK